VGREVGKIGWGGKRGKSQRRVEWGGGGEDRGGRGKGGKNRVVND